MIELKQWNGSNVTPADDAALYSHFDGRSGVFVGCEITLSGSNELNISAGRGLIGGRQFVVEAETVMAELASSGTQSGRLLVRLDLTNTETPIAFVTQAASVLPDLVQDDMTAGGTIYELVLATYKVTTTAVINFETGSAALPALIDGNGNVTLETINTRSLIDIVRRALAQVTDSLAGQYDPITQYPTTTGVFRVASSVPGLPTDSSKIGALLIINGGGTCAHIYVDSAGQPYFAYTASTSTVTVTASPTTWKKPTVASVSAIT